MSWTEESKDKMTGWLLFDLSELPPTSVRRPVNFLSIDLNPTGWKSFLRDPELTPVRTHTKNSHPNLRHLFSIPRFSHHSTSLLSQSYPFSVFSSPFYPSIHPTNPPSIPLTLIPSLSVWVGPSVGLIKCNEVIYQGLLFSQHCSINHSRQKKPFLFLPRSAAWTMTRL